jgi:hypothetical protein
MRTRNGSIYIFVLGASALAAAAGVTAVVLHSQRLARVRLTAQAQKAQADAQSALEFALAVLSQDPAGTTWRSSSTLAFANKRYFGTDACDISIDITDPGDNDLTDSVYDPVHVVVSAIADPCEQQFEFTLTPATTPMSCLDYALVVEGNCTGASSVATSGAISIGQAWESDSDARPSAVDAFSATAMVAPLPTAPVMVWRMAGGGNGGGGGGNKTTTTTTADAITTDGSSDSDASSSTTQSGGDTARTGEPYNPATVEAVIPNATDTFRHYVSIGTPIPFASIPGATMEKIVLSPATNPYGATNAQGVYVIDCGGNSLTIRNCRIAGTLVLLNSGNKTEFTGSVCIEPTSDALPALLVQGVMNFDQTSDDLSETDVDVNFNPSGNAYDGTADSDNVDSYPSWINGLVYVDGEANLNTGKATIRGSMVVTDWFWASNNAELRIIHDPPDASIPGFAQITGMALAPGSLQRVVD